MANTFDPALSTPKDRVRFRVGDINGDPQWFLADESINALLALYPGNEDEVMAQCAETIGAICAQLAVRVQQRNLQIYYQNRSEELYKLADRIRDLAAPAPGSPANYGALAGPTCGPDLRDYDRLLGTHKAHPSPHADPLFSSE